MTHRKSPFNSPFETGTRSLTILVAAYPQSYDVQRLVDMDYLVVHSGDADGPESLHAPLPLCGGELLVRRDLIQQGLSLMMGRGLIERLALSTGIEFRASETASPFIAMQTTFYAHRLKDRADWAVSSFKEMSADQIQQYTQQFISRWDSEFQPLAGGASE